MSGQTRRSWKVSLIGGTSIPPPVTTVNFPSSPSSPSTVGTIVILLAATAPGFVFLRAESWIPIFCKLVYVHDASD
ncbi:uncharacterized protein QC764_0108550 [Podospora pseudoanserina]|uniref:Transmembrane protein n=1 Tax=Podospora pseudoanserina TaxID=2609844 RepID=A0ABR0HLS8_9PEZI|nr:hypothetical protein QC764_0108550 [Podospora pseudoanserina]